MCFSTTASFASGAILTVIGVASIKKVQHKKQILFACIPFFFAIQQFLEGFVWISQLYSTNPFWQKLTTYSFLFFALTLWPSWVPISMFLLEKLRNRKIILGIFIGLGLLFSILSSYYFINYKSEAQITSYHIHYDLHIPYQIKMIIGILYLIPTVISHFISSNKGVVLMGVFILISYFISRVFFDDYVLSVWCFFSALISATIYFILSRDITKKQISN